VGIAFSVSFRHAWSGELTMRDGLATLAFIAVCTAASGAIDHLECARRTAPMTTKLDSPLKRELQIGDRLYTLTLSPQGFTLALKGKRKGLDVVWEDLVSGDAALATALNASLAANLAPAVETPTATDKPTPRVRKA